MQDANDRVELGRAEAELVLHVLAAFERVLRHGYLSEAQLALLIPDGVGPVDRSADVSMAEIVVEAGDPLRRQTS